MRMPGTSFIVLNNKEELNKLYNRYTTTEIAEQIGCSDETVRQALKRHKIKLRKQGHRSIQDQLERSVLKIKQELRKWPLESQQEIINAIK